MAFVCESGSQHVLHLHVVNPTNHNWKYHVIVIFDGQTDNEYDVPLNAGAFKDIDVILQMPEVSATQNKILQIYVFENISDPDLDLGVVASETVTVQYTPVMDTWTLTITVTDIDTGGPISGVSVNVTSIGVGQPVGIPNPNFDETKTTDLSGKAVFRVTEAQYKMTVSASGYYEYSYDIGYIRPDVSFPVILQKTSSQCPLGQTWDDVLKRCVTPLRYFTVALSVSPKIIKGGVVNSFITTVNSQRGSETVFEGAIYVYRTDGSWVATLPIGRFTAPAIGDVSAASSWHMAENIAPSVAGDVTLLFDVEIYNINNPSMRLSHGQYETFTKVPPTGPIYSVSNFTFNPTNHQSGVISINLKNNSAIERNILVVYQLMGLSVSAYYNVTASLYDGVDNTIFQPGQTKVCKGFLATEIVTQFYPGMYNVKVGLWDYTAPEAWPTLVDLGNVTIS